MTYCGQCGKEMPGGAAFCPACGASTVPGAAAPLPSPAAPAPFVPSEAVAWGWRAMRARTGLLVGCALFYVAVQGAFQGAVTLAEGPAKDPNLPSLLLTGLGIFVQYSLMLGIWALALAVHDGREARFADIFSRFGQFLPYLGMMLLKVLIIVGGLVLLVVPGVYWALCLALSDLALVDRRLGPVQSLQRSAALTRGHRGKLFALGLLLLLVNLGGALCLLVGLLFTIPASWMALAHAYRRIEALSAPPAPVN